MVVCDRIREAPICGFLVLKGPVIERSAPEIHQTRGHLVENFGRSRVPRSSCAAAHNLRPVVKTNMPNDESFFPTGTVVIDLE